MTVVDSRPSAALDNKPAPYRFLRMNVATEDGAHAATEKQEIVLNLAAKVSSVEYNRCHNAEMFTTNMQISTSMMAAACRNGIEKFLVISSSVVYPEDAFVPTPESEGGRGRPERVNEGYGWAKRMSEELARYYCDESDMCVAVCRPSNVYGPRDHWNERDAHVIPALVSRILDEQDPLVVWGSGKQTRAFLHVKDAALGMKLIVEKASDSEPINLGTKDEVSIEQLVSLICRLSARAPNVVFDTTKPDGHVRRVSDLSRLHQIAGWVPSISIEDGVTEMIEEYERFKRRVAVNVAAESLA